jgi:DNA-binding LacI/PurR family transcriptional regulator
LADLADIARELNVSSSLVSKVLNGRLGTTRVSAKTVRAIHARARNLNYQRNASAAALAMGKQNVIGVFIHRVGVAGSGIVDAMVQGVAEEAARHHLRLVVNFFNFKEEFIDQRHALQRGVMDGVIIAGMNHPDLIESLNEVQDNGLPVVTLHDNQLSPQFSNIGCSQLDVGRLATSHLISRGCRRIAHITKMEARYFGYKAALADAGIAFDPELVYEVGDFEFKGAQAALARFRSRGIAFDGFFAQSDQQAAGFMNDVVRRGGRVPQDVKVIGVDNSPYTEFTIIPLSSISQQEEERGRRAVRILLEQTADRDLPPRAEWIAPVLHARESTDVTEVV